MNNANLTALLYKLFTPHALGLDVITEDGFIINLGYVTKSKDVRSLAVFDRNIDIYLRRHGLRNYITASYVDIGKVYNISSTRARQIVVKMSRQIKHYYIYQRIVKLN